ncbi:MAG TPA: Clp protease N-terminal domain-containing protein [Anaerolineaceae bacterium]
MGRQSLPNNYHPLLSFEDTLILIPGYCFGKKRCGRFPELDKFTQKAQEALFKAQQLGRDFNHQAIEPSHLLLALLQQV